MWPVRPCISLLDFEEICLRVYTYGNVMEQVSISSIRSDHYVSYSFTIEHMIPFSKALSGRRERNVKWNFREMKF